MNKEEVQEMLSEERKAEAKRAIEHLEPLLNALEATLKEYLVPAECAALYMSMALVHLDDAGVSEEAMIKAWTDLVLQA